jgi:hypothetical protein
MTIGQAYRILGLGPGAGQAEIAQAHAAALRALQLQLVPGTPLAVRQRAQDQIVELHNAYELLKTTAASTVQPTGPVSMPGSAPTGPFCLWALPAGLVLAAIVLVVALLGTRPSTPPQRQKTARLRVLSVPWSEVTVDGKSLGPSGQVEAFLLKPGDHKIVLRQGDRVLSQTVHLPGNSETIIKAQFEKGQIDVVRK